MEIIRYPEKEQWKQLTARPERDSSELRNTVASILADVKAQGDEAVKRYTKQFDHVETSALEVTPEEFAAAEQAIDIQLKQAIEMARRNIWKFHSEQLHDLEHITTSPGVECWQKYVGIEKVGLYVPGGTAPLFSTVLMLGIPAQIAECAEIVLCTPPRQDGSVHPAVLYAAKVAGVHRVFKAGGVQAIAAMAYGTESISRVYKIFGPGNQFVTAAKQMVSLGGTAIDMPAGPSEVEILADETAVPAFVAADMLSQAEHGTDSQAMLVTIAEELIAPVQAEIERQLELLPRKDIARRALQNSKIILMRNMEEAVELTNAYAPEHLIISTRYYWGVAEAITNAGSVFLGNYTPESAGDYASGTNHTLPTNGHAKAYSGVNIDSFLRKITFQHITRQGLLNIGNAIGIMATHEGLAAHRNAVEIRLDADPDDDRI